MDRKKLRLELSIPGLYQQCRIASPGQFNLPFSPDSLPSHTGELRHLQERHERRKIALIPGVAHKSSERMRLTSAGAAAVRIHVPDFATSHPNVHRALAHRLEVDIERTGSIKRPQAADAIADPREEHGKFGPLGQAPAVL